MKRVTLLLCVFFVSCMTAKATETLQEYVAKYKFPQGSIVTEVNVVYDNGALSLTSTLGKSTISKTTDDHFSITTPHIGTAIFVRNEAKKITGIKMQINGVSIEGTREIKDNDLSNLPVPISQSPFPMKFLPVMLSDDGE